MAHTETSSNSSSPKNDPAVLAKTVKEPTVKRDPLTERMTKRGDTRRRLEDLMLSKESKDLW